MIVKLKPVEWEVVRNEENDKWLRFHSVFGTIDVLHDEGGCRWKYCVDEYYDEGQNECASIDEGKAEAEKFYLGRLEAAFERIEAMDFDSTARTLARAVLDGQMDAVRPLIDRLMETMT